MTIWFLALYGSYDRAALSLEDPERPRPHRHEIPFPVVDPPFDGRRPAGTVDDLAPANDASLADRAQEVHVHLRCRHPQAHQGSQREPHSSVQEGGIDPAVQAPATVEVYRFDVRVSDCTSRLNLLDM